MKKKTPIVILVLIIIIVIIIIKLVSGTISSAAELAFEDAQLSGTSFYTKASFLSSGKSLRRYTYKIENNVLYITVYGGLVNKQFPKGDFVIYIRDDLRDVSTVYLRSKGQITTKIHPLE